MAYKTGLIGQLIEDHNSKMHFVADKTRTEVTSGMSSRAVADEYVLVDVNGNITSSSTKNVKRLRSFLKLDDTEKDKWREIISSFS